MPAVVSVSITSLRAVIPDDCVAVAVGVANRNTLFKATDVFASGSFPEFGDSVGWVRLTVAVDFVVAAAGTG